MKVSLTQHLCVAADLCVAAEGWLFASETVIVSPTMPAHPAAFLTLRSHPLAPTFAPASVGATRLSATFSAPHAPHGPLWPPDPPPRASWSPVPSSPAPPPIPDPLSRYDRYRDVWWVLDPQHAHQCPDCRQLAANSPYSLATLYQMPGDGHTYCGHDCTCIVSFVPPEQTYPPGPPLTASGLTPLQRLLRIYTHGQIWYLALAGAIPALLAAPSDRGWPRPDTVPEATPDRARFIPPGLY